MEKKYEVSASMTVDDETHEFHSVEELDKFVENTIDNMMKFLDMANDVRNQLSNMEEKRDFYNSMKDAYINGNDDEEEEEDNEEEDEEFPRFSCVASTANDEELQHLIDAISGVIKGRKNKKSK